MYVTIYKMNKICLNQDLELVSANVYKGYSS